MRTIDADALKELFREVIGSIAKKPEMNGNLEHMIRASAMVIQMIDDAPTVQPDTTTHDSIPAETSKNDGDRTSGDCISRRQAIDALKEKVFHNLSDEFYGAMQVLDELPSVQPEIIRCKDCKYCEHWYADKGRCLLWHEGGIDVFEEGFCNYAERREDG